MGHDPPILEVDFPKPTPRGHHSRGCGGPSCLFAHLIPPSNAPTLQQVMGSIDRLHFLMDIMTTHLDLHEQEIDICFRGIEG